MNTQKLNDIEVTFELPTTPKQLRELADRIEHLEKGALQGQVIRVKIDHRVSLTYKVMTNPSLTPFINHIKTSQPITQQRKQ